MMLLLNSQFLGMFERNHYFKKVQVSDRSTHLANSPTVLVKHCFTEGSLSLLHQHHLGHLLKRWILGSFPQENWMRRPMWGQGNFSFTRNDTYTHYSWRSRHTWKWLEKILNTHKQWNYVKWGLSSSDLEIISEHIHTSKHHNVHLKYM